ncbi:MAG: hypothetical protein ABSG78_10400 [Verrucomicrobiota bacterium]
MRPIVPPGYAVPKQEIERLTGELRQARAGELARASEKDRARIEKEINREVQRKIAKLGGLGAFVRHFGG